MAGCEQTHYFYMKMNFLKKSFINVVNSILLGIANLVISIILARKLGPAGVGQYQLVVSSATIIAALSTFGIGGAAIYYINNKGYDITDVSNLSLKFSGILSVISFPIILLILKWQHYFGEIGFHARLLMSLYCAEIIVVTVVWPILMAELKVVPYALVSLIPRLCLLILLVAMIAAGMLGLTTAWVSTGVSQLFAVAVMLWFMRGYFDFKLKTDWSLLKSLFIYGSKLNLSYIILILNGEIGILIIRALLPEDFSEIGYYSRAVRIGALLLFIAQSIGPLLYAKWSGISPEQRKMQIERVSRCFVDISLIGVLLLVFISSPLIMILYGEEYIPCVTIFRYLLPGITARFLLVPHFRLYSSSGYPLLTSLVLAVNLVIMGILMVLLIPDHLARGAAVAFSVSNVTGLIVAFCLSAKYFRVSFSRSLLINAEDIKYLFKAMKF